MVFLAPERTSMLRRYVYGIITAGILSTVAANVAVAADADVVAQAKVHAKAGSELLKKQQYREALEEFRKAMTLKRTRGAVGSVASTLKLLGRYDEALEMYEELLAEFKDLPPAFLSKVNAEVDELRAMMGTVVLAGDAPAGATVFVDDRLRGKLPFAGPLRLAQGMRAIRIEKEGFSPITTTVEVLPAAEKRVELEAKERHGRLVVREKHNWPLFVEIDGKDVGVTPWNGLVAPGEHRVRLHGFMGLDVLATCEVPDVEPGEIPEPATFGAKMESPRARTLVGLYEQTELTLGAVEIDASLRVDSTPKGALVMVDYGQVGLTPWEGRLPLGEHVVEVSAEGFVPIKQTVKLERRKDRELGVVLPAMKVVEPERFSSRRMAFIISSFGMGAVGMGVGAATGIIAQDRLDALTKRCGGTSCTRAEEANLSRINALAGLSTAGFVVGSIGIAAGALSIFTAPPQAKKPTKDAFFSGVNARVGWSGFLLEGNF